MEVKCTQCGGAVPVGADQGLATCPFCGSSLFVDLQDGVGHFKIMPVLEEKGLGSHLSTHLARKERRGKLTVDRAALVYWPYWVIQDESGDVKSFIATAHPITDMENVGVPAGDQRPFVEEERQGVWVEPPSGALEKFLGREGIEAKKSWLLHLPFWQVEYTYGEISYEAWVDAVGGGVHADDLPPTFAKEKDKIYGRAVMTAGLIYLVLGALIPDGNTAAAVMIVASVPLYFVINNMVKEEAA